MSSEQPIERLIKLDPDKQYFVLNPETNEMMELSHDPEPLNPEDITIHKEHGASGVDSVSGSVEPYEYNPKWRHDVSLDLCEQMRRSDASVRSVLQVVKLPLMRATWKIVPGQEDGGDEEDKKRAKKLHDVIIGGKSRVEGWRSTLSHHLTMLDFGFAVSEIVFDVDREGFYYPYRIAPRLARTIREFRTYPDGSLKYVRQEAMKNGKLKSMRIPTPYIVHTAHDQEGDNYWGIPLLRYLYQHYYYKTEFYRIDAVRLDRFGIGIPIIEIEKGYVLRPNDKRLAETILKGLRSHHRAYAMLPAELKLKILTPENERGGASGLMEAVDHHDVMMARAVLAHFLTMGQQKHGNYGTSVAWADLFLYGLQALANLISEAFTIQVVRPIYDLNWEVEDREYPKMMASSLEDINGKELAAAMYNLVLGQVLTPDDDLETHVRALFGLPRMQKGFSRKERGAIGEVPGSPAEAAANVITGKPSDDDREAGVLEPTPGTKPSTTPPPRGPIRAPGDRG
jgi:phage gp29-like protein